MRTGTEGPTRWPTFTKDTGSFAVRPNLADYEATRRTFSWDQARKELSGLPGAQGLNMA